MKVWIVEYQPSYEQSSFIGVYATEELAEEAKAREVAKDYPLAADYVGVWEEDVVTELPPLPPVKPGYQVIP